MGGSEYVVRGRGRFTSLDDIRNVAIGSAPGGTPVTVGDVANVQIGPEIRRGIADLNGKGEIVTGWVVMRYGGNPLAVINGVKTKMAELQKALPKGVVFVDGYDRSGLIESAIATLRSKLVEESLIVAGVTLLFLLHGSSALVAILIDPDRDPDGASRDVSVRAECQHHGAWAGSRSRSVRWSTRPS